MDKKSLRGASGLLFTVIIVLAIVGVYGTQVLNIPPASVQQSIEKFSSCTALADALKEGQSYPSYGFGMVGTFAATPTMAIEASGETKAAADYSETNIQVEGVDEADIVKTDGKYIYTLSGSSLVIALAYPPEDAAVLSETGLGKFYPSEIFIDGSMVMIFGYKQTDYPGPVFSEQVVKIYPYYTSTTTVKLFDISDPSAPEEVRSVEFEGNYVTSRKIGSQVYFVVNSHPKYNVPGDRNILPLYRDTKAEEIGSAGEEKEFQPICDCADVGRFDPMIAESFITVASVDMSDPEAEIKKETVLGSGQNVYSSKEAIYIAEAYFPYPVFMEVAEDVETGLKTEEQAMEELKEIELTTSIHKFSLGDGLAYLGSMQAPGTVLNQFSMDEHNGHFRVATTRGFSGWFGGGAEQSSSVYVFNDNLELVGSIEGIAPGEQIYSARFLGDRGYMVTFKKIDPFFVIDLADPANPRILGKLKIPGYSDYLHPYDENHIIGIGKETVGAKEGDFAWFQGLKMAVFDVTDVSNPKELHKIVIGDRGTDSDALHDHKAFLFDKEKNLLVIPVLLAEIKDKSYPQQYGDFVFQGAYVYSLTLEGGFELKGTVTHYESNEEFKKSGYYFRGDHSVHRSLYIGNVLYTLSEKKLKLNYLDNLSEIKALEFGS